MVSDLCESISVKSVDDCFVVIINLIVLLEYI